MQTLLLCESRLPELLGRASASVRLSLNVCGTAEKEIQEPFPVRLTLLLRESYIQQNRSTELLRVNVSNNTEQCALSFIEIFHARALKNVV